MKRLHAALALVAAVMAAAAGAADLASPAEPAGARAGAFIAAPDLAERIMSGDDSLRLFDLRPAAAYQQFHIPTARRVEPPDLGAASLSAGAEVVLYGDSRVTLSAAVRVLRTRRQAKVLVLREGVSEWLGRVHEPRLAVDATPEERAQFDRAAALSRFFGGVPLAGVARSEVPVGYWTGAPRTDELLEAAALQSVALIPEARVLMSPGVDFAALRRREFSRLDAAGSAYLDYTGTALYPESLVRRDGQRLLRAVYGNPHSESAPSLASTGALEEARRLTLRFFDADPREYDLVFTANASGAIRILAEAFPFRDGSRLVVTADNHNSVNGLRLPARRAGAEVEYVPLDGCLRGRDPRLWLPLTTAPSLFAFPAQSNFSGVRHPLTWVQDAQVRGYHVLLDAAAYVPTRALSLAQVPADFVALSFYKMFGYPSGVGALLVRRPALAALERRYFAGGTVQIVSVQNDVVRVRSGSGAFEDGTPNFLAMPAVCDGLQWLLGVGMAAIDQHVRSMTAALLDRLSTLRDRVRVYGPTDLTGRGGVVAFNLYAHGRVLDYETVEAAARARGVAIRGGCFCNPGAAEHAFGLPAAQTAACLDGEFSLARLRSCLDGLPVGALRASLGPPTTSADLDRLLALARELTTSG